MFVMDLQRDTVHGSSIAPKIISSTIHVGQGVDLGNGSLVGHLSLHLGNMSNTVIVTIQESPDDVNADYVTTTTFTLDATGDQGTEHSFPENAYFLLQFTRNDRWCRVKVDVNTSPQSNVGVAAAVMSQFESGPEEYGAGSSVSPAGEAL